MVFFHGQPLTYWQSRWHSIHGSDYDKAIALLAEYSGGFKIGIGYYFYKIGRLVKGRWNTHHGDVVAELLNDLTLTSAKKKEYTPQDILNQLKSKLNHSMISEESDLAKIISVIQERIMIYPIASQISNNLHLNSSTELEELSNEDPLPETPLVSKKTMSKEEAAKFIFFSYKHQKYAKAVQPLTVEQYPSHLVPIFRNKQIINNEKYRQYCELFDVPEEKRVITMMRNYISRITFDKFLKQLHICMTRLEKFLLFNPDAKRHLLICNDKGHSQEWVNQLVNSRLQNIKGSQIQVINMGHPPNFDENQIANPIRKQLQQSGMATQLYFDDCSYSGTQICSYIQSVLFNLLSGRDGNLQLKEGVINFIFIIPYMKKSSAEALRATVESIVNLSSFPKTVTINFELITSGVICPMKDLTINKQDKELFLKAVRTSDEKPLAITDWKMPDYVSFPHFFMEGLKPNCNVDPIRFLPGNAECKPY